jgi:uncharacterized zinc-type alcohol dehydrogenase-like protein
MPSPSSISALAALAKGGALEPWSYEPAPLGAHDVEIEISHCGLCHSDIHLIDDGWGRSAYPLVPGHEIAGKVSAAGAERVAQSLIAWRMLCCSCSFLP